MIPRDEELPKLRLEGRVLERVYETKYLGITLDHKLTWTPHINNKITQAKGFIGAARSSIGKPWGPKPQYVKWLYTAVARPALTYGCLVWGTNLI